MWDISENQHRHQILPFPKLCNGICPLNIKHIFHMPVYPFMFTPCQLKKCTLFSTQNMCLLILWSGILFPSTLECSMSWAFNLFMPHPQRTPDPAPLQVVSSDSPSRLGALPMCFPCSCTDACYTFFPVSIFLFLYLLHHVVSFIRTRAAPYSSAFPLSVAPVYLPNE